MVGVHIRVYSLKGCGASLFTPFLFDEIVKTMVRRQHALELTGPSILAREGNCMCVF